VEQYCKCPLDIHHLMVLTPQGNVKKKNRAREMQVDFNLCSAQQMKRGWLDC
jgi:hypothetical protein